MGVSLLGCIFVPIKTKSAPCPAALSNAWGVDPGVGNVIAAANSSLAEKGKTYRLTQAEWEVRNGFDARARCMNRWKAQPTVDGEASTRLLCIHVLASLA